MPTYIQDMVQAYIDLLSDTSGLKIPENVKAYYFGIPNKIKRFPSVWVQFNERKYTGKADTGRHLYNMIFEIGIVCRSADLDKAEKDAYDFVELIDGVLDINYDLSTYAVSIPRPRDVTIERATVEDQFVAVVKIFDNKLRWVPNA